MLRSAALSALFLVAAGTRITLDERGAIRGEAGTYEIGRKLGSGAYGQVFLATEATSGRQVVAKVIELGVSPEAMASFRTERDVWLHMRGCAGYPHPNIIEFFEVLQLTEGEGVIIMELAGGGSLSSLLYGVSLEGALRGERTPFGTVMLTDEAQAKKLFAPLAAGVQWLAQCGVIHKDLKPDNIMFCGKPEEGGVLKIIDFGLAAVLATKDPGPIGNMYYNLDQSVDIRTKPLRALTFDNFALGMMLAELGTGVPPFFNPPFDYFSNKPGNLQNEKGLIYILADRKTCERGDAGLWYPKKDLALGKTPLRKAVAEVAGRSLYFLKHGSHFPYASAFEKGIDDTQLVSASWLHSSDAAMELLSGLMQWNEEQRIDPRRLLSDASWLATPVVDEVRAHGPSHQGDDRARAHTHEPRHHGGGRAQEGVHWPSHQGFGRAQERALGPNHQAVDQVHTHEPSHPGGGRAQVGVRRPSYQGGGLAPVQAPVEKPATRPPISTRHFTPPSLPQCLGAYKEPSAPSICSLSHRSDTSCYVRLSCNGAAPSVVELGPPEGFGSARIQVEKCFNCQLK